MRATHEPVTVGGLLRGTVALLDPLRWLLLGWTVFLTLVSVGSAWAGHADAGSLAVSVLGIVAARAVVLAALQVGGYPPHRLRLGFIGLIVLQIVTGLGLLLGALLLVVPFFILLVRWWVAVPVMATEDIGPTDALGRSWQVTAPHWRPLAGFAAIVVFAFAVLVGLYVWASEPDGMLEVLSVANIAFEVAINVASLILSLTGASAFLLMRDRADDLGEVFA